MIVTSRMIEDSLVDFSNAPCKLGRMVRDGHYHRIIRGLFETDPDTPGQYLAQAIYTPSYLSFDYALSRYGLIPEAVFGYTSATFRKRRSKSYDTPFGYFHYRDVPDKAFPHLLKLISDEHGSYWIAEPEKALCDKVYTIPPVKSLSGMRELLFEDLRIDEDAFEELDTRKLAFLSDKYGSTNVRSLLKVKGGSP